MKVPTHVATRLEPAEAKALRRYARRHDLTVSQVLRAAVRAYIKGATR